MDPEQTFIRVQERFSNMLTPRIRVALEYVYLVVAVSLFALLVVMHANYVQQPGCSSELSVVETAEAQLVHIKITSIGLHSHSEVESDEKYIPAPLPASDNVEAPTVDGDGLAFLGAKFWLNWFNSGVRRSKLVVKSSKTDTEYLEPQADSSVDGGSFIVEEKETKGSAEVSYAGLSTSAKESVKAAVGRFCSRWQRRFSFCYKHAKNFLWSFSQLLVETYSTERAQRKVKRHSAAALVAMDATVPDVKQQDQSTIHNVAGNISQLHSEDVKDDHGGSSKSKTKKGS